MPIREEAHISEEIVVQPGYGVATRITSNKAAYTLLENTEGHMTLLEPGVPANVADASGPRPLDLRAHRQEDRPRTAKATALQEASTTRPALRHAALRSAVLATFFATGCHWILQHERELRDGTPTDRRDRRRRRRPDQGTWG